jgi:hypothetical protein
LNRTPRTHANFWIIGFFAATRQRMLRCTERPAHASSSAGKCAHDHDFPSTGQASIELVRLNAVDEKSDVPATALLLIDDPKAKPGKAPIEIGKKTVQRVSVRIDHGDILRVVAKRSGDQNAHKRSASKRSARAVRCEATFTQPLRRTRAAGAPPGISTCALRRGFPIAIRWWCRSKHRPGIPDPTSSPAA